MGKNLCGKCTHEINDLEPIHCALCEKFFHIGPNCCGMNIRTGGLKENLAAGKVIFVCESCRSEMQGRSVRCYVGDSIKSQSQPVESSPTADLPMQVQQLSNVVAELSKKIDGFANKTPRPRTAPFSQGWPRLPLKRRREERPEVDQPAESGTNTIDLSDLSVPSITAAAPPPPEKKFWLYLSRLNPLITDDDVRNIVSRCLRTTDAFDVVRLVPKGREVAGLTFVSFKIGLDPNLAGLALNPAS